MTIYIFRGQGASGFSAQNMKFALSMALQNWSFDIQFITAEEIRNGKLSNTDKIELFVMGGGSFTDVKKGLGVEGIEAIKNYIADGGGYCGVCMGAYAAFDKIQFQGAEVREGHGLSLFNSLVRGHINITPPYDGTAHSATIIDVHHKALGINFPALYWGGFDVEKKQISTFGATPLSSLKLMDGTEKILSFKKDRGSFGRPIFLSAYHFEAFSRRLIWQWLHDQKNGKENSLRIQKELIMYSEKSYYMGLACALDHMELVKDHSFHQNIWPEIKKHQNSFISDSPSALIASKFE